MKKVSGKSRAAYRRFRIIFTAILMALAASALVWLVLMLPRYLLDSRGVSLTLKDRLDIEAGIRSTLVQILGGAVVVLGLYFTARGFHLTREGHITDRYAKAIEHLGSSNADVRIGGIYSLARLARDSQVDGQMIIEVLTSFVREHTRTGHRKPSDAKVEADVQAAISVLATRPDVDREHNRLDFYHSGLNDADFRNGDFRKAMFDYSRLDGASFSGARLDGADLSFCTARGAAFTRSTARGAHFVNAKYVNGWFLAADLTDCDFYGCDLSGSDFGRRYAEEGNPPLPPAALTNARFTKAKLRGTNLRGIDLRTVRGLTPEQLKEAITDDNTLMPIRWMTDADDD
jgi:hypothetical protein